MRTRQFMQALTAANNRRSCSAILLLVVVALGTPAQASEFVISIIDAATRQPVAARIYVENLDTGTRHFVRAHSTTDGVIYERQNWANKNSIEHHTSVPAAPFVAENLPAGTYLLTIERGKEYSWRRAASSWQRTSSVLSRQSNSEAPAFLQPPHGGTEGDEFDWLAYTLGQYYTLLNAGFPLVPTAGTASGVHPVPAGFSRVYVPLEGRFSYEDWLIGLRGGRSFVTTGPMLFAKVNDQHPGATLSGGQALLKGQILSEHPLKTVDVVLNGRIIPLETRSTTRTEAGAWQTEVNAEIACETSGWLCLRCTEDRPDGRLRFAHSAPWRMEIPEKRLRPSQQEKDYLVHRVQQEIVRSTGLLPDSALAEYQAALQHFESLPVAEAAPETATHSEVKAITPEFTSLVAADAGLWPQIQVTDDGTLLAFGYNAPAHTTLPADVECWSSSDGGKTWSKRGIAAPRPTTDANYCHWASGVIGKNELLVIASGMDDATNAKGQRMPNDVRVFRSTDAGANWKPDGEFPLRMPDELKPYPFGSIVQGADGQLRTLVYTSNEQDNNSEAAWIVTSSDRGQSWGDVRKLANGINESVLLPLPDKEWLCVARTSNKPAPEHGQELRQFRSVDNGQAWTDEGLVAGYHLHPPHLLQLSDGRILLTYGNRRDGSIEVRLSNNNGHTWNTPLKLYTTGLGDMGYPSTAQMPDGRLVTVFYAQCSPFRDGYHMGAIGWTP